MSLEERLKSLHAETGVPLQSLRLKVVIERLLARLFLAPSPPWLLMPWSSSTDLGRERLSRTRRPGKPPPPAEFTRDLYPVGFPPAAVGATHFETASPECAEPPTYPRPCLSDIPKNPSKYPVFCLAYRRPFPSICDSGGGVGVCQASPVLAAPLPYDDGRCIQWRLSGIECSRFELLGTLLKSSSL